MDGRPASAGSLANCPQPLRPMADPNSRKTYPAQTTPDTAPTSPIFSAAAAYAAGLNCQRQTRRLDTWQAEVLADREPEACTSLRVTLRRLRTPLGLFERRWLWPAAVSRPPHWQVWRAAPGSAVTPRCDAGQFVLSHLGCPSCPGKEQKTLKPAAQATEPGPQAGFEGLAPHPARSPLISRLCQAAEVAALSQVHAIGPAFPLRSLGWF